MGRMDELTGFLWIDLEMTGLNVDTEVIIEAASVVTDLDLNELHQFEAVVYQPPEILAKMDDWNQKHHHDSGLLKKIPSGEKIQDVERQLIKICEHYFADEPVVLAGNSIGQDRLFINKYMPDFSHRLHYRMLDVSSWKLIFLHKYNRVFEKKNQHRAVMDIKESISELRFYLDHIRMPSFY